MAHITYIKWGGLLMAKEKKGERNQEKKMDGGDESYVYVRYVR